MQRNWIGRSQGLEITFDVEGETDKITVFTTRPDTLLGATFLSIAPEHPLSLKVAKTNPKLAAFIEECKHARVAEAAVEAAEKKGVETGLHAIHPITCEKLPVWAANFVLMGYGSGAVMAVPGHDQRDWEFAKAYGLPLKAVIGAQAGVAAPIEEAAYTEKGVLVASGAFDGLDFKKAFDGIAARQEQQKQGRRRINYRLRDWGVSRQR